MRERSGKSTTRTVVETLGIHGRGAPRGAPGSARHPESALPTATSLDTRGAGRWARGDRSRIAYGLWSPSLRRAACVLTLAVLVPIPGVGPAAAQTDEAGEVPDAPKRDDDDGDADEEDAAPDFEVETKSKEGLGPDQTERSIRASIDNQKRILQLQDPDDPEYPEMVVELADYYWDLSRVYFRKAHTNELEQAIYDAEQNGNEAEAEELKQEQQSLIDEQERYQQQTIDTYRQVIRRHPDARNIDEIRYFLAYHLGAAGRAKEAVDAYKKLILKSPESEYVPDALVNIGEYYFNNHDYENALKLYKQVEQYPKATVLPYAIYKQAWCHYNLADYELSLSRMIRVLKLARKRREERGKVVFDLVAEAQNELIYPYSKVGKPSEAIEFFKRYAPERHLKLAGRLADLYTEQTEYDRAHALLQALIREARELGGDRRHLVLRFQRQTIENAHAQVDKPATVEETRELIRLYEELRDQAPSSFLDEERDEVDALILEIATGYHEEYKNTKDEETLEYTQVLYDEYLRLFGDAENAYKITYNNALLMDMQGKYRSAAREFERVIEMHPEGKFADDAAERAVAAHLESIQVDEEKVKTEAKADLSEQELSARERRFIDAVDRWLALIEEQGTRAETRDNIPPARFAAAKILYNANHFHRAAKRFLSFVDAHPEHEFWVDAARHVLSCYNLAHDVDNLQKYANRFAENPRLMETKLSETINRIRNEINFQECFKHENREAHLEAAECFMDYAADFPDAEKAPSAIYNAGLNFFRARRVEKALETQKRLFEEYRDHELAAKALYSIGEIFRETTVYDQAARVYERFVDSYPDHPLAEKALRYASIFRKTLEEYDRAIEDLRLYLDSYPDPERSPQVHLDIVLIREKQGNPWRTIEAANEHLERYPDEPAGIRLQVLATKGRAFKELDRTDDATHVFRQNVEYFRGLESSSIERLDRKALSAAAQSHFNLGEVALDEARRIRLTGSEEQIVQRTQKKLKLMKKAKDTYAKVTAYGHPGWTIAAYTQLGLAYRNLADAVENAEVPDRIEGVPAAVAEYKSQMAQKAEPIRQKALASYRKALEVARKEHWFNEYSKQAEQAIAKLDLQNLAIKEARLRPGQTAPNSGFPDFKEDR